MEASQLISSSYADSRKRLWLFLGCRKVVKRKLVGLQVGDGGINPWEPEERMSFG